MTCEKTTVSGNVAELAIAEETCLKELSPTAPFQVLEPNSFGDFGGSLTTSAREPISTSRQRKKGAPVSIEASASFESDFTISNFTKLLQGVFFADIRELATNTPINGAKNAVVSVVDTVITLTKALPVVKDDIIKICNDVHTVVSVEGAAITVGEKILFDELKVKDIVVTHVGKKFTASDVTVTKFVNGGFQVASPSANFKEEGYFIPGSWIFIKSDSYSGFARLSLVTSKLLTFDVFSIAKFNDTKPKSFEMYFGNVIKNESDADLIKTRSYTLERRIGRNDKNEIQAEYVNGAIANEFTLNTTSAEKVSAELSFVACDNYQLGLTDGDPVLKNPRLPAANEGMFNSTSNVYDSKLHIYGTNGSKPLFAYITEIGLVVNNNINANNAIGHLGAIGMSEGLFEVGGNLTAYFSTFDAVAAVRKNSDVGLYTIYAADNAAFLFDIPLLTLGGGIANVEKDNPVTVPFEPMAAESEFGHTLLYQQFPYLPL